MKRSEMIKIIAEQLFYRDMAKEHQFWFNEDDRPILDEDENKDSYISDAIILLNAIEKAGLKPPLTKFCPVLLTKEHVWQKEEENGTS